MTRVSGVFCCIYNLSKDQRFMKIMLQLWFHRGTCFSEDSVVSMLSPRARAYDNSVVSRRYNATDG